MRDLVAATVSGSEFERRQRSRVNLRLQCLVERPGQRDPRSWKHVENISRGGMLIRWGRSKCAPPAVGEAMTVKLKLPPNPFFGQRWMLFDAKVVRVTGADTTITMVALAGAPVRFSPPRPVPAQMVRS
jgi:hypothetical protein